MYQEITAFDYLQSSECNGSNTFVPYIKYHRTSVWHSEHMLCLSIGIYKWYDSKFCSWMFFNLVAPYNEHSLSSYAVNSPQHANHSNYKSTSVPPKLKNNKSSEFACSQSTALHTPLHLRVVNLNMRCKHYWTLEFSPSNCCFSFPPLHCTAFCSIHG